MAELVAIGLLSEYVFCPRSAWLAYAAGLFQPNEFTVEGEFIHRRVHALGHERKDTKKAWRKVLLFSQRLGLVGYADMVEFVDGKFYPVEYKRGKAKQKLSDQVQLCAQALCLEEMTRTAVETGFIYYARSRRRIPVHFDQGLRRLTISTVHRVRDLLGQPVPPPAILAPKCHGCAQYPACLPDAQIEKIRWEEELL